MLLTIAGLIQNPGEPRMETRFRDPAVLAELGFNGLALYETVAWSGVREAAEVDDAELRAWLVRTGEEAEAEVVRAQGAGLEAWLCTDALALPAARVAAEPALRCTNRADRLCIGSDAAVDAFAAGLRAMLRRHPGAAGVVLRVGETDAARMPHLTGNDVYRTLGGGCTRCRRLDAAERVLRLARVAHAVVVQGAGRRLILRAWNVRPGGMHDDPAVAEAVAAGLPGDPAAGNLLLSFKFTAGDFRRYQPWNPASLACGAWPVLYELQCQREFEGKGVLPDWQAPLWRDGPPEAPPERARPAGLAAAASAVNFAGTLGWVRGGGWGGPFVSDETWIDANAFAAAGLARAPDAEADALRELWLRRLLPDDVGDAPAVAAARERLGDTLTGSAEACRELFYLGDGYPVLDDDLVDGEALWQAVQRLPAARLDDELAAKTRGAAAVVATRRHLQRALERLPTNPRLQRLMTGAQSVEPFAEFLRDLVGALVAWRRHRDGVPDAATVSRLVFEAQTHWNHHTQRPAQAPGMPSAFRERGFWELSDRILEDVGA